MSCPNCGEIMEGGDSGEPDYFPGWWCPVYEIFFADDDPALLESELEDDLDTEE